MRSSAKPATAAAQGETSIAHSLINKRRGGRQPLKPNSRSAPSHQRRDNRSAIGLPSKDRRAAQLPERPSSACSSSTLRGDLRTSAPGAYLPAVSASGTCAYRRAARAARRPDLMDTHRCRQPQPISWTGLGKQRLRLSLGKLCPLSTFSTRQDECTSVMGTVG